MKIIKSVHTIIFYLLIIFCIPSTCLGLQDAIIAIVNDELITLKDLKDYVRSSQVSLMAEGKGQEEIRRFISDLEKNGIQKLIEDKLILSKANEMELEINQDAVNERVQKIMAQYPSEQAFLATLIDNGATITDLKNKIIEQLKIKYIVEIEIKSKIFVNPNEVTQFYEENTENFKRPERINLDSIFIPYEKNKDKALNKAQKALTLLQEGQPFDSVAKEYSQSPSIGIVEKGQFLPEIEDVAFSLQTEEISPIVKADNGVYIFKLKGRLPQKIETLEDVRESIYDMLFHQKFRQRYKEWVEELKKNAYIEIKE